MASSRRQYPFHLIEPKWQQTWEQQQAFRAFNPNEEIPANHPFGIRHNLSGKIARTEALPKKFYILDMFPYPSGAGLHVGHPEGYTATDILARYKRAQGFNVLHPMGWDAFGLPAEQYAVKTGQHPRVTTEANIANFTRQIKSLGFSYDWSRELATTDVEYFKWTQWIFLKLYNSWFNPANNRAESISTYRFHPDIDPVGPNELVDGVKPTPDQLKVINAERETKRRECIDKARLAYVSEAPVNWCPELGTVLANEEVIDGKSEVGGFPVIRKPMRQWMLRITAYAEKLLADLDTIDWSDSLKEMQRNWIGRSEGAEVNFSVATNPGGTGHWPVPSGDPPDGTGSVIGNSETKRAMNVSAIPPGGSPIGTGGSPMPPKPATIITVFTTRPDTLFGATYMVLAPEHKLVDQITTPEQRDAVAKYKSEISKKSDLERTELAKEKTGVFTGAYAINPVNGEKIPIWIADYVLASYGTGAIMAVPAHDERDFEFAINFRLPIRAVVKPPIEWLSKNGAHLMVEVKVDGQRLEWTYNELIGTTQMISVGAKAKKELETTIEIFEPQIYEIYARQVAEFSTVFTDSSFAINSANKEISLNGLPTAEAKKKITAWLEEKNLGKRTINYKLRDWLFSRQRYWGEPFPIIWKKDAAGNLYHEALPESSLPLLPPTLEDYKPTASGEPPLARAKDWLNEIPGAVRETNTMPQWAGSCWYYLRYTDAKNAQSFVGKDADNYWMGSGESGKRKAESGKMEATPGVDLYVGGTEHAVLHLLYARFWHKVLFDLGYVSTPEPFFKLVNQGLILGEMEFTKFSSANGELVSVEKIRDIDEEASADGLRLVGMHKETGEKVIGQRVEFESVQWKDHSWVLKTSVDIAVDFRTSKMSKSRGNVVNPDDVLGEYGADAFRLYEMFMGPLQDTKPWNTRGVEGVYRFLGRAWRLFVDEKSETAFEQAETLATEAQRHGELLDLILLNGEITDMAATPAQLKTLHACIKKVTEDLDGMRFNTAISAMMVFINEAMTWPTKPLSVMKPFLQLLAPFAPHIAEELWARLHSTFGLRASSLPYAPWPKYDAALLVESEIEIPVSVNGKMRDVIKVAVDADNATIEAAAKASEKVQSFIAGKTIKKIIIVPKKMVNLIVG